MNPEKLPKELRKFRGYKNIKLGGMTFTIQRINPLSDIKTKDLPMIFSHIEHTDPRLRKRLSNVDLSKQIQYMTPVIKAGVVKPEIVEDANNGFVVEDFFRDPVIGFRLWENIINHSLNRFRGIRGVFFSIVKKLYLFIRGRKYMAELLTSLLSQQEGFPSSKP